jgi:SAM-dependent methyltransferase
MGKDKLSKFAAIKEYPHVFEHNEEETLALKGNWRKDFFKNDNPIVLELGCGKGEYSVGLAERSPNKNFIGIDIKGARFWRGAKTTVENGLHNVAFLRTQIELIEHCFATDEVSEIWITFPDPQIKYKRTKHRMTNATFLENYKKALNHLEYSSLLVLMNNIKKNIVLEIILVKKNWCVECVYSHHVTKRGREREVLSIPLTNGNGVTTVNVSMKGTY